MEIIGVDTGNKAMKTPGCDPFSTGLISHGQNEPIVRCETLMFEGVYYSLNQSRTTYKQDKTVDNTYYLLTLIAIAKNLMKKYPHQEFYKCDICLAMGLPPQHMKFKKKYLEYFGRSGKRVNYTFNDVPFEISVKHVFVYPQGFSVTADSEVQSQIKKYSRSYVVDIGGYTTDVIRFNGNKKTYSLDLSFCESFDRGIIEMLSVVESELRSKCSLSVDDYMAESILIGDHSGDMLISQEDAAVAKDAANAYATELIRGISEKVKDDFKTSYFVFMGGGAVLMRDAIEKEINPKNLKFIDDVTANAKGYEIMARAQLTKLGEL